MSAVDLSTYGGALLEEGYVGQVVDLNTARLISRTNDTAVAIDFGDVVVRSAGADTCKKIAADTDKVLGFAVRHPVMVSTAVPGATPVVNYPRYESVPILENGRIFATPTENVTQGDPVYVVAATGALTKTSGAGSAAVPGAVWDRTNTSGALSIIKINN